MLSAGFEPAIPEIERSLTYALDRTVTDIAYKNLAYQNCMFSTRSTDVHDITQVSLVTAPIKPTLYRGIILPEPYLFFHFLSASLQYELQSLSGPSKLALE